MMKRNLVLSLIAAFPLALSAQKAAPNPDSDYSVIPRPVVLTPRAGHFELLRRTVIHAPAKFNAVAHRFARDVADATSFDLAVQQGATAATGIVLRVDPRIAPEGYQMEVNATAVVIRASDAAGAYYGLETFKQLLPPDIYRNAPLKSTHWLAPSVHIEDAPRFGWRGMHLDVARHFMPKEFVKKYIDLLARHKMNRFHWHLTEDQGWRIEIKKYPKLTEIGSCRDQTLVGPYVADPAKRVFDGIKHCGYYTQDDIREVVAYAAERFITIVPEIEMPGHAQAAIAAYPDLGVRRDTTVSVFGVWGVSEFILNADASTVSFMQDVLGEVLTLFPGQFIHIGGDEAIKTQWKASPQIQARIKELGVKDENELQSWFIRQMDNYLTSHGRRLVGWDEILEGGLAENATVMSWRGTAGGIDAARAGHDVVMAPNSHTYFDHLQSRNRKAEPLSIGGFLPLDTVYAFEPVPAALNATEARHILGAQAQVWTEYIPDPKHVEYMLFPRMAALAEAVWTPNSRRSYSDFMQRLQPHLARLQAMDVNFRPLDKPPVP
ncbi:MAG: beta-N-acetylhexosaminidase [Gemmatimonadaceae bacterium]